MSIALLAAVVAIAAPYQEPADSVVRLRDHAELSRELAAIVDAHPDLVARTQLGASREGRAIEALRLTGSDAEDARPGILVVANLEGPRVYESAVVLHHARRLAEGYATDEALRGFLDSTVVYLVPSANPDGAEARFQAPRDERVTGGRGVDNDRDGRDGEDPPSDVDGDGLVTWMRVADPDGEWIEDPTDARVLVRADPVKGEHGVWELHREGRDLDGDERVAEDPQHDTRLNQSFPSGWAAHEDDTGLFPTDEPEARALLDFVIAHPELSLVLSYGGLDNLVAEPESVADDAPAVKRVPPEGVLESDAALLEEVGERYRELTGNETETPGEDGGSFQRWTYDHRGLLTLNAVLWSLPSEAPEEEETEESEESGDADAAEEPDEGQPEEEDAEEDQEPEAEPSEDAEHLLWIDAVGEDWRFDPWTSFEHPELGTLEVGGFAPYARLEPPRDEWDAIAEAQLAFLVTLGELVPRIRLAECEKEEVGPGLWRVTAVVQNDSLMPLRSRSAKRTRTVRPALVELRLPEGATLVAGQERSFLNDLDGSGGRHEYTWLVQGSADLEIAVGVDTDHAGDDARVAEVAR